MLRKISLLILLFTLTVTSAEEVAAEDASAEQVAPSSDSGSEKDGTGTGARIKLLVPCTFEAFGALENERVLVLRFHFHSKSHFRFVQSLAFSPRMSFLQTVWMR